MNIAFTTVSLKAQRECHTYIPRIDKKKKSKSQGDETKCIKKDFASKSQTPYTLL